jgi:hypothetical protein
LLPTQHVSNSIQQCLGGKSPTGMAIKAAR